MVVLIPKGSPSLVRVFSVDTPTTTQDPLFLWNPDAGCSAVCSQSYSGWSRSRATLVTDRLYEIHLRVAACGLLSESMQTPAPTLSHEPDRTVVHPAERPPQQTHSPIQVQATAQESFAYH